jgi:hypothetical protein
MGDEIKLPREGLTTLTIAFTKKSIAKITDTVRSLQKQGWDEEKILERMRREMPSFDPHTIRRLYALASGQPVNDDFAREEITSQKAVAENTFELQLAKTRPDLPTGAVVRFLGADWCVKRASGTTLEIRRIV